MKKLFLFCFVTSIFAAPYVTLGQGSTVDEAFGANIHLRQRIPAAEWEKVLDEAQDSGVEWSREEFEWDVIEPTDDNYSFTAYDAVVDSYQQHNIEIVGLLTYSSDWASTNPGSPYAEFYAPDEEAWRDYVGTVAEHYKGDIDTWEIWNEPNHSGFFRSDFLDYVSLLVIASEEIKKRNPNARIVLGGLSGADSAYLDRVLTRLNDDTIIDIVAIHPYRHSKNSFNYAPEATVNGLHTLLNDLYNIRAVMKRHRLDNTPIWLTEVGWTTYAKGVSQRAQMQYLTRLYALALSVPQVRKVFWYSFTDTSTNTAYQDAHFGLLTDDYKRKLSFFGYKYMKRYLSGYHFKKLKLPQSTLISNFSRNFLWQFSNQVCTTGKVQGRTAHNRLRAEYRFLKRTNCYAPIVRTLSLPRGTKSIQFNARGSNDETILRVRITDRTQETFQYDLGLMPDEWLPYIVQLNNYAAHWGGDNDGQLDGPLSFQSFVIDNGDGSIAQGRVLFDDLYASTVADTYQLQWSNGQNRLHTLWNSAVSKITPFSFKSNRIRVMRLKGSKVLSSSAKKYRIKATPIIKFVKML